MRQKILHQLPDIDSDEMLFLETITSKLPEEKQETFYLRYRNRRRKADTVLIMAIIGLIAIPGLQRFYTNKIGLGLIYFFTIGLCLVGSIVDIVNYRKLTLEYNEDLALDIAEDLQFLTV